ncbi:MAG TPA: hypothetical protein VMZ04_00920, partial [Anaerolineae bacterium]|nr:hypothetical protein [Anaerolineae bacterium]
DFHVYSGQDAGIGTMKRLFSTLSVSIDSENSKMMGSVFEIPVDCEAGNDFTKNGGISSPGPPGGKPCFAHERPIKTNKAITTFGNRLLNSQLTICIHSQMKLIERAMNHIRAISLPSGHV